jgi:phosphoserine phosphatase
MSAASGSSHSGPPFASIWFDCDSTLSAIEGVDELLRWAPAALCGEVAALTRRAMEGSLPLDAVYGQRLRLLAPRAEQVEAVGRLYCEHAVPDAREVVAALRALGKQIGIMSGGMLPAVRALAQHLGIDAGLVHAVALSFDAGGAYRDFDRATPLCRNGGKAELVRALPAPMRPLAFVGDGATDLETQGAADLFVGYGGVAVREVVRARAQRWFATPSLAPLLGFVLTADERQRVARQPEFAALLARAGC